MAKFNNPMKVITGVNTRWSYANVWEAKSINGGTPKFSVSLIIPKSDTQTVEKIKAAIQAAYQEGEAKLKGNSRSVPALSAIKTPLRDGDVERPDDPAYANSYFINANSTTAPPTAFAEPFIYFVVECVTISAPHSKVAHKNGVPLIVDNTFPTPIFCRPFEWGADIVISSTIDSRS